LLFLFNAKLPYVTKNAEPQPDYNKSEIINMIKETRVEGCVTQIAALRADMSDAAAVVTLLPAGSQVEILRDSGEIWYLVRGLNSGKPGWVRREALTITPDGPTDTTRMNKTQLEDYANIMGYNSQTRFLVVVDISRQQTHVFKGEKHKWELIASMGVSTGKNESPTVRGDFKLTDRGLWFYSERLRSGAKYWVRFDGPYLFHSVAMDRDGNVTDGTLGRKSSNGCIRLSVPDAEWFYKNVPDKTRVVII